MVKKLLAVGLLCAAFGFAQGRGRGGGGGGGDEGGGMPGGMQGPATKTDQIALVLSMSKDQKKGLKTLLEEGAKEAAPLRDEITKSRIALGEAIVAKKSDEELKSIAKTSSEASTKLVQIEVDTFAKIVATLDDSQKKNSQALAGGLRLVNLIYHVKNWNEL